MTTMNIFGKYHESSEIMELYEAMQNLKNSTINNYQQQGLSILFEKTNVFYKYLMFKEMNQFSQLITKFTIKQFSQSFICYQYLKQHELQIEQTLNGDKIIQNLEQILSEEEINLSKTEILWQKSVICSLKLLSKQITNEDELKTYYKIHKQLNYYLDQNQTIPNQNYLPNDIQIFNLPYHQYILLYSSIQILINSLKFKLFLEFTEKNYQLQTQLLPKILEITSKKSSYHTQIWKFQSILLDVTQNLINFNELFSVTPFSFKNEGIQKLAFSFNNIQRGLKVMKIITEESILKYFYESIELKIEEQASAQQSQQQEVQQFKPKVQILFHGLEDINLDNPKQTKLDLEIKIQIGENEFLSLNNSQNNFQLVWNYEKIKHFHLILLLFNQIIDCAQLWMQYIPKNPKDYFEYLCSKVSKQKLDVDRTSITNWFQKEKPFINNTIEAMSQFLESLEFVLLKIESSINKEIQKYQKEKPIVINKEKLQKILIQSGFKVEYEIINRIELRLSENMKTNLELILIEINPKTQKIKGFIQQIKKSTSNFK